MIYIRVDANKEIATGHVMRCLSIAKQFLTMKEEVTFIVADNNSVALIENNGFSVICLESRWNDLNQEIEMLSEMIKENKVKLLLIDSYYVTPKYLDCLNKITKIAYIDDIDQFDYPVDYLINYNFYGGQIGYKERVLYKEMGTRFALGAAYVPLRTEFSNVNKEIRSVMKRILILTGGSDFYNVAGDFLDYASKMQWFERFDYDVIVGAMNPHKKELISKWSAIKNVHLHQNVQNMSHYMKECDFAITAGGVTTYELCACGIPSVMYTLADNQMKIAEYVSKNNIIEWVGDIRDHSQSVFEVVEQRLLEYENDYETRIKMSKKMQSKVDGKGCVRICEWLCKNSF